MADSGRTIYGGGGSGGGTPTNMVTTDTEQQITGKKVFAENVWVGDEANFVDPALQLSPAVLDMYPGDASAEETSHIATVRLGAAYWRTDHSVSNQVEISSDLDEDDEPTLWVTGKIFENGERVYSPNNPPSGIRVPSFTTGRAPGFGIESTVATTPGGGAQAPSFDIAYQLDTSPEWTSTNVAVDDDWFTWAPGDSNMTVKQAGFYWVIADVYLSAAPADPWTVTIFAEDISFTVPVPGDGLLAALNTPTLLPVSAGASCGLVFTPQDGTTYLTGAGLTLVPLF